MYVCVARRDARYNRIQIYVHERHTVKPYDRIESLFSYIEFRVSP